MRHKRLTEAEKSFVERARDIEERMFLDRLDHADPDRMTSDRYSWHYRPSHHAATGLLTEQDVTMLSQPGRRLLSVGAHPAYFERVLYELGVPAKNIVLTDRDTAVTNRGGRMRAAVFDATTPWPDIGTFDRIIFPESLCMCVGGDQKSREPDTDPAAEAAFPGDAREAEVLAWILRQALQRLRPGGEIRANGPMSHPNVVKAAGARLGHDGSRHIIDYQRFFLTVRGTG